jgi:hypothetical protein
LRFQLRKIGHVVLNYWNIDQVGTNGAVRPPSEWRQARTLEDAVANPVAGQRLPPVSDIR